MDKISQAYLTAITIAVSGLIGLGALLHKEAWKSQVRRDYIIEHAHFQKSTNGMDHTSVFDSLSPSHRVDVQKKDVSVILDEIPGYPRSGSYSFPYAKVIEYNSGQIKVNYVDEDPCYQEMVEVSTLHNRIAVKRAEKITQIGREIDWLNER